MRRRSARSRRASRLKRRRLACTCTQNFVREWFPEALQARFQPDAATGNLIWQGKRYQPTPFLKPPLGAGFVLIAEPYVLIVLHTL